MEFPHYPVYRGKANYNHGYTMSSTLNTFSLWRYGFGEDNGVYWEQSAGITIRRLLACAEQATGNQLAHKGG